MYCIRQNKRQRGSNTTHTDLRELLADHLARICSGKQRSAAEEVGVQACDPTWRTNLRRTFLIESRALLQLLVQLAFGSKLEDQIDPCLVIEVAIQAQNVRMPATQGWRLSDQLLRVSKRSCQNDQETITLRMR